MYAGWSILRKLLEVRKKKEERAKKKKKEREEN